MQMARFIRTDRGWLNLDHVARIGQAPGGRDPTQNATYNFYGPAGDQLGSVHGGQVDWAELTHTIVLASHDAYGYQIYWDTDDGPLTREQLSVERIPIIAWRVGDAHDDVYGPSPVF